MKIITIIGARPQIIKSAAISRAIRNHFSTEIKEIIVHTGQHYDENMSEVFFDELSIPRPNYNLNVGSGSHGAQTARMLEGIENIILTEKPDALVVYGDTNSTVAGGLAASKLDVPLVHIEAGLRSFNKKMPEEINRKLTDQLSDLLLITSPEAELNLINEGLGNRKIVFVGNSMIDTLLSHLSEFDEDRVISELGIVGDYAVATLHRPGNVDDLETAQLIVAALGEVSNTTQIILPLHPRGKDSLYKAGLAKYPQIKVVEPLNYIDFISLVKAAKFVVTDSGGVQEETTILKVPCLTLRPNTERPITITHGTNQLVTVDNLVQRVTQLPAVGDVVPPLWDGKAGQRIAAAIVEYLGNK
jgi:UDP-N-acetylglucosamine 2-epimerase (non-hydrolysing)